jgi:2-C-methyl-D-erythritol 4-phosphate cytidylyltransferase
VFVVEGERSNIKVTLPEDILFAEALIREGRV